jgi:hypothetical protein
MSDLIESRISEIRERLAAATPGPWHLGGNFGPALSRANVWGPRALGDQSGPLIAQECDNANADFIAHAPADLEALLAEREGMKAEIERLREYLAKIEDALVAVHSRHDIDAAACDTFPDEIALLGDVIQSRQYELDALYTKLGYAEEDLARLSPPLDPSSAPSETPETQSDDLCVCGCRRSDHGTIYQPPSERTGACMTRGRHDGWCPAFKLAAPDREAGDGTDERAEPSTAICFADDEDGFCGAFRPCPKHESEASAAYHAKAKERLASSHPVPSEGGGE